MKEKRRAFITGVTGQDGSYLAEFLLEKDYKVFGMKRRSSQESVQNISHILSHPDFHLEEGDLLDLSSLVTHLNQIRPREIYNLAAQSHVGTSFKEPITTAQITGLGALHLLEALRLASPKARFYQASSSELFGNSPGPHNETTPFSPQSPYAAAKAFAHHITKNYRKSYNLFLSIGILFNHESPRRSRAFVSRKITSNIARIARGELSHFSLGNLDARRDWGYAKDYVRAMWLMLQQNHPDDFVIATGKSHSIRDFLTIACQVAELGDWKPYVQIDPALYRPSEVHHLTGDASKAEQILGFRPETSFNELVSLMVGADLRSALV